MYEVISAFVDNEAFDPAALAEALATAEGRDQLLDIIAIRGLLQAPEVPIAAPRPARRPVRQWLLAAAALLLVSGGYAVGRQLSPPAASVPTATTVFTFEPGVNWDDKSAEGGN
jgi:hypothetical protein